MKRSFLAAICLLLFSTTFSGLYAQEVVLQKVKIGDTSYCYNTEIVHMDLTIRPDFMNESVTGMVRYKVIATESTNTVLYDAKGRSYKFKRMRVNGKKATYTHDGRFLTVNLPKTFKKGKDFKVSFDYYVKPGEDAPVDKKGLYFINSTGKATDKPIVFFSHSEPDDADRWFPTHTLCDKFDAVINITVPDSMITFANGYLYSQDFSTNHSTRTDKYIIDWPQASYLYAVGAMTGYTKVKDPTNGPGKVEINYLLPNKYSGFSSAIFPNTRYQLEFFGEKLGFPYPFKTLTYISVPGFPAGAMENTTMVPYSEILVLGSNVELAHSELAHRIPPHELFHHWFGDIVTCETWGQLVSNEGFARLGETLWAEEFFGENYLQIFKMNRRKEYFRQAYSKRNHPLVDEGLALVNPDTMFDAISYTKGGLVLQMLRCDLGDSLFFGGLNDYLRMNAFKYASVDSLRLSLERFSGKKLQKFFDQWYFQAGHPIVEVVVSQKGDILNLTASQIQKELYEWESFDLKVPVLVVYKNGTTNNFFFEFDAEVPGKATLSITKEGVKSIQVDPTRDLLVDYRFVGYTINDWQNLLHSDNFGLAVEAADSLIVHRLEIDSTQWNYIVQSMARMDPVFRVRANRFLPESRLQLRDENFEVRIVAIGRLKGGRYEATFKDFFDNDPTLEVRALALTKISEFDSLQALNSAINLWEKINSGEVMHQKFLTRVIAERFAKTGEYYPACTYFAGIVRDANASCVAEATPFMIIWLNSLEEKYRDYFLSFLKDYKDFGFESVLKEFEPKK